MAVGGREIEWLSKKGRELGSFSIPADKLGTSRGSLPPTFPTRSNPRKRGKK
jgi:hypothetical protein